MGRFDSWRKKLRLSEKQEDKIFDIWYNEGISQRNLGKRFEVSQGRIGDAIIHSCERRNLDLNSSRKTRVRRSFRY